MGRGANCPLMVSSRCARCLDTIGGARCRARHPAGASGITGQIASSDMTTGADALRRHAPGAADALNAVVVTMWADVAAAGLTGVVISCGTAAARLLDLAPLPPPQPPTGEPGRGTEDDDAIPAFAEQMCLDVASVSDDQRTAFLAAAGDRASTLAAALWVVEFIPRSRAALDALFALGPWPNGATAPVPGGLWAALDGFIRAVPALEELDPVTSELVRLRGARQHDCRLCRSLRNRTALRAGATEAAFRAVDNYAHSDLSPLQRAALAVTDAMIWTPGRIDDTAIAGLRAEADPAQQVEVVLDVTRNAVNKVAVALGADAAHVDEGVEIYDVAPDGSLLYGLEPD
jgi:alkylhydroperoxidase family enzyme